MMILRVLVDLRKSCYLFLLFCRFLFGNDSNIVEFGYVYRMRSNAGEIRVNGVGMVELRRRGVCHFCHGFAIFDRLLL